MAGIVQRIPLHYITREELEEFKRSNRDLAWALKDIAPYMRARDQRAFRHWVFAMGWYCCLQYYEERLHKLAQGIVDSTAKSAEKALADWEKRTRMGLLDSGTEEWELMGK